MSDQSIDRLVGLDRAVDAAEGEGVRARWEFGRDLLGHRIGKQLPKGLLDQLVVRTQKSRTELQYRMQFAERYPTEVEVSNVLDTFGSWYRIVNEALPTRGEGGGRAVEPGPLPGSTYRAIVADPPWQYDNKATRGAAENHYLTMTVEALCALPVEEHLASDAHLYLWTTNGFLREAFDVVGAWGFDYKTCLTWVKPQIGLGNYFRSATEHVLFGTRGQLAVADEVRKHQPTWFEASRGKHSAKPDCFYDLVERANPGPYLEMFSRRARFGWDHWGNEALESVAIAV